MKEKEKSDIKFSERFSLKFRKIIIANKLFTFLVVCVLIAAFVGVNIWLQYVDLPEIDVTENQIYTLSDSSKEILATVDQDIKIYVFGIDEDDSVVGLIKQYCEANDKITYEMLSSDTNLEKVQEFELEDGYSIVVIESADSYKIIDASSEFYSYDYTTYTEVDTTEQTLTNSILSLSTEYKPKVYFVEGHNEFSISSSDGYSSELGVLTTYLGNEAFEVDSVNLMTSGSVPEDCDVLAIMSPETDFLESEAQAVIDYIYQGGNIFLTKDVVSPDTDYTNFQKILDVYGVTVENGYILETDSNYTASSSPYVFIPQVSSSNEITADIYTDSYMWLAYSEKLDFLSDEELEELGVTYEELLSTTDSAIFITDFSSDMTTAASTAQTGEFTIAALVTKSIPVETTETEESTEESTEETVEDTTTEETTETTETEATDTETTDEEEEETETIESKLVICGNGEFITDYIVSELSSSYPISYLGSNKDFAINAISVLAEKENVITIRKDMAGTSYVYTATETQNRVVLAIIFIVPVVILLIGIIIWRQRKKRK